MFEIEGAAKRFFRGRLKCGVVFVQRTKDLHLKKMCFPKQL